MNIKEQIRAEIDKRYAEYRAKMKTDDFTYYEGMADALDLFEQYIDTFPDQPEVDLEEEIAGMYQALFGTDVINRKERLYLDTFEAIARHFAEWGAEHLKR